MTDRCAFVSPGSGTAIVGPGTLGLVAAEPGTPVEAQLRARLASGASGPDLTAVLTSLMTGGLGSVVVALLEPGAVRLFVCGAATATATYANGAVVTHTSTPAHAWEELFVADPARLTLRIPGNGDANAAVQPLLSGVARSDLVDHRATTPVAPVARPLLPAPATTTPAPSAPAPPPIPVIPAASGPAAAPDERFDFGHLLADTVYGSVEDAAVRTPTVETPLPGPPIVSHVPGMAPPATPPTDAPRPAAPSPAATRPGPAAPTEPMGELTRTFDTTTGPLPPPVAPGPPPTATPAPGLISAVPGMGDDRPPPPAALAPVPQAAPAVASPVVAPPVVAPPAPPPPPPPPSTVPSAAWSAPTGTGPVPAPTGGEDADDDDEDAPTIGLAQLRAAQAAAAAPPSRSVQAVHCPAGHPNPPFGEPCRDCGSPITDRTVTSIARPVLGRVRFDDGTQVRLDAPLVVGRKPKDDVVIEGEPATAIRVPDPDTVLSRTHLEVRLVDWQVQIVDRDSMNHTYVEIPGHPPTQLLPAEPFPIPLGTVVSMGDSVRFTYEVDR